MDNEKTKKNIERFESLMCAIKRDGMDEMMNYIRTSDFYTAPASTKFHLSTEGGLLQHSLNVYDCLMAKKVSPLWSEVLNAVSDDAITICSLLHDLCKTNFYTQDFRNQKSYDPEKVKKAERFQVKYDNNGAFIWETVPVYAVDDKVPYGHGEKSVMMIEEFMKLKPIERYAIRWHMGYTEPKEHHLQLGQAIEKYPLILALNEADQEASSILEGKDGNKSDIFDEAESVPDEQAGDGFLEC